MNCGDRATPLRAEEIDRILRQCGLELTERLIESVRIYFTLLQKWNQRINLTSLRSPSEIVTTHFAESFFAAQYLEKADSPVLDIGSGAGFPGLAMKLSRPDSCFYLLEPRTKRAAFLSTVRRELGLSELFVLNKAVEECQETDFREKPALLTERAVGDAAGLIARSLHFSQARVRAMLFLSRVMIDPVLKKLPQFTWWEPISIPWSRQRVIVVGQANVKCST